MIDACLLVVNREVDIVELFGIKCGTLVCIFLPHLIRKVAELAATVHDVYEAGQICVSKFQASLL